MRAEMRLRRGATCATDLCPTETGIPSPELYWTEPDGTGHHMRLFQINGDVAVYSELGMAALVDAGRARTAELTISTKLHAVVMADGVALETRECSCGVEVLIVRGAGYHDQPVDCPACEAPL